MKFAYAKWVEKNKPAQTKTPRTPTHCHGAVVACRRSITERTRTHLRWFVGVLIFPRTRQFVRGQIDGEAACEERWSNNNNIHEEEEEKNEWIVNAMMINK